MKIPEKKTKKKLRLEDYITVVEVSNIRDWKKAKDKVSKMQRGE